MFSVAHGAVQCSAVQWRRADWSAQGRDAISECSIFRISDSFRNMQISENGEREHMCPNLARSQPEKLLPARTPTTSLVCKKNASLQASKQAGWLVFPLDCYDTLSMYCLLLYSVCVLISIYRLCTQAGSFRFFPWRSPKCCILDWITKDPATCQQTPDDM